MTGLVSHFVQPRRFYTLFVRLALVVAPAIALGTAPLEAPLEGLRHALTWLECVLPLCPGYATNLLP